MFRVDIKSGELIADEHCHTSTVPHKLAKKRTKTGNYGLAKDAREQFAHLVLQKDPVTGELQFPIPSEEKDKNVPVKVIKDEVYELKKAVPLKKMMHLDDGESLWNNYAEVVELLCSLNGTNPEDYVPIQFGSTVSTVSSLSVAPIESAVEEVVKEEPFLRDEDIFENLSADVVPVPDIEEDDEPEPEPDAGAVGGSDKKKKKKKKKGEVEHDPFEPYKELDFRDLYKKEFPVGKMIGDKTRFDTPAVDYYWQGEEDPEDEFYVLQEMLEFEDLQRGHVRLFDDELDY